jgi:TonB-linked SusC/RagA family outer membrane protein
MKIFLAVLLALSAHLLAVESLASNDNQETKSVKEVYISLQLNEASIEDVFRQIEYTTGFYFIYDQKNIDRRVRLNITEGNISVADILMEISRYANLKFKQINNSINVKKKDANTGDVEIEVIIQSRLVTGRVVAASDNLPIPGVNVFVKDTNVGTITDLEGEYSIEVPEGSVLIFSFVGYNTIERIVGNQSVINVQLVEDIRQLENIVIVGYGAQRKSDLTGSVSSVRGDDLLKIPAANPLQALQGKVAGVQINNTSGEPGSDPTVRVRGVGTIGDANPVYVVDGVILSDISFLNTNDIFSIELLKDASATAIYGSRGANGVFIVTTKQGGANVEPQITFRSEVSVQRLQNKIDLLSGREFAQAYNEIRPGTFNNLDRVPNVDWQDLIFVDNPIIQSYDLSASGGGDNVSFYLGLGMFNQEGIIPKSDFSRYTVKVNSSYRPSRFLNLGTNITGAYINDQHAPNVVYTAYGAWPTDPPFDEDGNFAEIRGTANPLAAIEYTNAETNRYRLVSNTFADFTFFTGLRLRTSYQTDLEFGKGRSFTPVYFVSPLQQNPQTHLSNRFSQSNFWIWENTLNFNREITIHRFDALAGVTFQRQNFEAPSFSVRNLIRSNEEFWYLNASLSDSALVNMGPGDLFTTSMLSYLFRLNYTFDDRFLFTGTYRIDGSSNFAANHRFASFPSLALGWNITNEGFFPEWGFLNNLKLRASWGIVGNEKIPWADQFTLINNTAGAVFGQNPVLVPGSTLGSAGNPALRWESTEQYNLGVEFLSFDGRLSGEIDYYRKNTYDILVLLSPPGFIGLGSFQQVRYNAANVLNTGLEFNLGWESAFGQVGYRVHALGSTIRNEVKSLGAAIPADSVIRAGSILGYQVTATVPGHPIGSFTGYDVIGIYQTQADLDRYPSLSGQRLGDLIYRDVNGDGRITNADRVIIGSPVPDFIYGFGVEFDYGGFNLALDFQGQLGNDIYNGKNQNRFTVLNFEGDVRNRWTGPGTSNTEPRMTASARNFPPSTYYLEDGSFLRLRSASLSYSLPANIVNPVGMNRAIVYLRGTNVFTLTNYSGYSPEIGGAPLQAGIDMGIYPITSVYSIGVNFSF